MRDLKQKMKMKPNSYIIPITYQGDKRRASAIIQGLEVKTPPFVVTIEQKKLKRSVGQNSLYWKWATIIGEEVGMTMNEQHEQFKRSFLMPILERDNEDYANMMDTIRTVYKDLSKEKGMQLNKHVMKFTSTTALNTKQFTEYLEEIETHARNMNIQLPSA